MSATAPQGSPSTNTGSVDAVATSATITGEVVSRVINHADATSFIHMHVLAVNHVSHNRRNTGLAKGARAPDGAASVAAGDGGVDDMQQS
jgi:hypothetical protein